MQNSRLQRMAHRTAALTSPMQGNLLEMPVLKSRPKACSTRTDSGSPHVCTYPPGQNQGTQTDPHPTTAHPLSQKPHLLPDRGITLSRRTSAPWNGRVTKSDLQRQERDKCNTDLKTDSSTSQDSHLPTAQRVTPTTQVMQSAKVKSEPGSV